MVRAMNYEEAEDKSLMECISNGDKNCSRIAVFEIFEAGLFSRGA